MSIFNNMFGNNNQIPNNPQSAVLGILENGEDYARMRDSRGRYMGDGGRSYGHMDKSEEKMYLEKMLNEARSDTEREIFRRKLDELNRM